MLVGEPWSAGKVAQATAAGVILGWAYYRYGIVVAVLVHIMVNYMLFALMYSIVAISGATIKEVQDSQFLGTIEILMVVSGIVAVVVLFLQTWQRGHTDDESVNHYITCKKSHYQMGFKTHIIRKVGIMFGILLITMLLTISLVGSNMDYILKQGVAFQIRSELSSDPRISASFSDHAELEEYIKSKIAEREKILGLDKPWYSPQRIGYAMYNIITLDFGQAVFLTSDAGSSDVLEILAEKLPRTVLLFTSSTAIIALIGIIIGSASASRIGSATDRFTSAFAVISSSFPVWWIGMLMILLFAFALGIFPARATPDIAPGEPGYYLSLAYHMVLPLATIVLIGFGSWSYLVRNFMIGAMQEEHIFAKRAIGISKRKIV